MDLGAYTFAQLPRTMTLIRADRYVAHQLTYSDVAFFSWGPSIIGKEILLEWNAMAAGQFASLDSLYQADEPVVFDPTDVTEGSTTYNVEIIRLDGEYSPGLLESRFNVQLALLILSEVA